MKFRNRSHTFPKAIAVNGKEYIIPPETEIDIKVKKEKVNKKNGKY